MFEYANFNRALINVVESFKVNKNGAAASSLCSDNLMSNKRVVSQITETIE